jgi:hypothetical protein
MKLHIGAAPGGGWVSFGVQQITDKAVAHTFRLGSLEFGRSEFLLVNQIPSDFDPDHAGSNIGALGLDFLASTDFELDFRNNKLNLYGHEPCPGAGVSGAAAR